MIYSNSYNLFENKISFSTSIGSIVYIPISRVIQIPVLTKVPKWHLNREWGLFIIEGYWKYETAAKEKE